MKKTETIHVKADSVAAKIIEQSNRHRLLIRQYINKEITLDELKKQGVRLVTPLKIQNGKIVSE
jgi:hypothetical protein